MLLTPAQLQACREEREAIYEECLQLLYEIAYERPYFLKTLYGVRNALQLYRGYKDDSVCVTCPPSMSLEEFQRLLLQKTAA